mgnify:CR=1 FL=1|jgi:N-acetylmuramoyl-L-alanine amidase|tara:strand:- start:113 stop:835 length:723 start_codon:yes stop_codon:yes gene_type:complete
MIIEIRLSPNFSPKTRKSKDIKVIVIHYTGMQSKIESVEKLSCPKHKVSCHYLIDRQGRVLKMVNENKIAWHAGKSKWKNFSDLNSNSIGIELVNKGHEFGYEKFTNSQINKLIQLCQILRIKYKIKNSNIVGHSDIAPLRKKDPGEKFPWNKLEKKKIGISFNKSKIKLMEIDKKKLQKLFFQNLFKIGYRYFNLNRRSKKDIFIIKAFQRRFVQNKVSGLIDKKTYITSHFLANYYKN